MRGFWRLRNLLRRYAERLALLRAETAVARFPLIATRTPHGLAQPLVVSLTSFPPRYPTLAKTLKSLLDQTVAADRTILWLAHDDLVDLPQNVHALVQAGLEIRTCADLRSYKKLIPALQAFPAANIVTADDDIHYRAHWLATLVDAARQHPGAVLAHRCHVALFNADGSFKPYGEWPMATAAKADSEGGLLFPTGVGGVLYPPGALLNQVTDIATFQDLCPHADDVWFFWMARLAKTPVRGVGTTDPVIAWNRSQDVSLMQRNWQGGNDAQIKAMEQRFGAITAAARAAVAGLD